VNAYVEDVRGEIIGESPTHRGWLCYDGRQQGAHFFADSDAELRRIAVERKAQIAADCGRAFASIFPLDAWELRIASREVERGAR
jgi:hypothetical protein